MTRGGSGVVDVVVETCGQVVAVAVAGATFVGARLADVATYLDAGEPSLVDDGVACRQVPRWLSDGGLDALVTMPERTS